MVLKRPLGEREEDGYELLTRETKQRTVSSTNVVHGLTTQELASTLEPLIREWVRDEVQRACQNFCCSSPRSPFNALEPCGTTSLQLRFQSKFPHMLFTHNKVESENKNTIKLVLFDTNSNKIISHGPLSSLKINIVPLDGDFSIDDEEHWSQKDFETKIIHARDGKRPLIGGDLVVVLKDGIGDLGEVYFTDNSSWRRSRKFRLGARAYCGVRIREAKSEAFVVKDHRGESYKKHHPPALDDDIWRLEKIAKDGVFHKRLGLRRICTVKDFLQMYITNESSLRKIIGGSCNKTWETIIKHAKECVLDDKLYIYNCGDEGIGILFNSIFKIVGATFDGQNYLPLDKLAMPLVESLKQQFYKNLDGMLPMADLSVFGVSILTPNLLLQDFNNNNNNIPPMHSDQLQMQLGSPAYMFGLDNFSPAQRNNFILEDFNNGPCGEGCISGPNMTSSHHLQIGPSPINQTVDT